MLRIKHRKALVWSMPVWSSELLWCWSLLVFPSLFPASPSAYSLTLVYSFVSWEVKELLISCRHRLQWINLALPLVTRSWPGLSFILAMFYIQPLLSFFEKYFIPYTSKMLFAFTMDLLSSVAPTNLCNIDWSPTGGRAQSHSARGPGQPILHLLLPVFLSEVALPWILCFLSSPF